MDISKYSEYLVSWIKKEVKSAGAIRVVVGVSGGVDSAVVVALAKQAFPNNVISIFMPYQSDREADLKIEALDKQLGLKTQIINLNNTWGNLSQALTGEFNSKKQDLKQLAVGNAIARLRMVSLYYLAQMGNALVLGTDNAAEWHTGYFTKYGDGGVDLLPLIHLLKSDVYELARHLEIPKIIIDAVPSANLWPGQIDELEMGVTYDELDSYLLGSAVSYGARKKIATLHEKTEHKRQLALSPIKPYRLFKN